MHHLFIPRKFATELLSAVEQQAPNNGKRLRQLLFSRDDF